MRTTDKRTAVVTLENGLALTLDYAILVEDTYFGENYGISVISRQSGERVHICGITPSSEKIYELYERMIRYCVTPVVARDIVEDWLVR
ncbi:MAG: DUF6514 family protein [Oscillospiraceae bacterium]|jgi:hypothetical protein|nr:DUF6514 family protein [Oscillospiraceae bacterium]